MPPAAAPIEPANHDFLDFDDEEGWQDMPIVREDDFANGLDEEDQKKYHYRREAKDSTAVTAGANARGNLLDIDVEGKEWREKSENMNEGEYTRLRANEEDETDDVHLRTKYLFDEDKAMTPLSQMQATKNLLTEAQRIAYVGLCALTAKEMVKLLKGTNRKELKPAIASMDLWLMKIMGRLYYHMELETQEQKMIDSLAEHGVEAMDLVPALMTTRTVANPEYDPEAARKQKEDEIKSPRSPQPIPSSPTTPTMQSTPTPRTSTFQTTARVLNETSTSAIPGVSTTLSAADENVTLDIRWTVLCDLFLTLIADSVYDARSRVLLENVARKLGLGWIDVVKFESRVTEALEIQEDVEKMENQDIVAGRNKAGRKKRYMMLGLATLGGGLVIGLSAGLLAPVIGAGLGAAFTTIGIGGTTGFLAGAGGAAVITTGGVLTGSGIAGKSMARRTRQVKQFDILPLHNNKRVSAILTVPGFLNGSLDDPRLPFSVLDPIVGDVFSVLWEPEMIKETGSALKILTGEVLTQLGQIALQATVMTALMSAIQWPIILTKLSYLIDNPWSNALDRARAAGSVLAHVLMQRHLGVRPITLIGFSLGARVIFYALVELAQNKAFGIVQDVILLGATLTASTKTWCETRSVVSGRYVNGYAKNDWVLNYLFRATSGGVGTVAGLRAVAGVPGLENVDVTDKIAGHMSYRSFMPLILDQLGFPVFADFFDDPEEPDFEGERIVMRAGEEEQKKGWFGSKKKDTTQRQFTSRPPSGLPPSFVRKKTSTTPSTVSEEDTEDDLPPRLEATSSQPQSPSRLPTPSSPAPQDSAIPLKAGFDLAALKAAIGEVATQSGGHEVASSTTPAASGSSSSRLRDQPLSPPPVMPPTQRTESMPPPIQRAATTSPSPRLPGESDQVLLRSASVGNMRAPIDDDSEEEEEEEESYSSYGYMSSHLPPTPPKDPLLTSNPFNASSASLASNPFSSASGSSAWNTTVPGPSFSQESAFGNAFSPIRSPPFGNGNLAFGDTMGGLSFGGIDGAISSPPLPLDSGRDELGLADDLAKASRREQEERDRWRIPNDVGMGKKPVRDGIGPNPWG